MIYGFQLKTSLSDNKLPELRKQPNLIFSLFLQDQELFYPPILLNPIPKTWHFFKNNTYESSLRKILFWT